ncbi:hypothetical protein TWF217_009387 [Orbilia oligospora]|nr:hypothetical protein TWF128_010751 [Orbilia oligospora]KAF3269298.1 hypothetical protein TWF217_009387 [Orbilia oligospora]
MNTILSTLSILPPITTLFYYAIAAILSFFAFLFVLLFIFINTPGEFVHPYYESSSGFGNDHSMIRGYPGRRRMVMPPMRARGGLGYIKRTRGRPFFVH